ncbi:MAG: universal stress protein [Acidobacteria bacterium]|nr:universal stress protein [Acidobacteriota bacterium]
MTASPRPAFARVLCPTDFSEFATAALSYAAALAASYGSEVRLLHVLTPFPIVAPFGDVPGNGQLYESQRVQGQQALDAEAARVRRPGLVVDVELREGNAVHETLEAARDWGADLIVIGTHGRGGMERVVLGSVAEKVLRKAPCAVLTVPHAALEHAHATERIRHVLCAHDGSAASSHGVAYAVSLAERTGAKLTLVSVVESLPYGGDFTGPDFAAFHTAREAHAREVLDSAVPADVRERCNVHDRLVYGHPAQQILEVAAQDTPDLLVMGVQGRGAFDLMVFGSTANHVVRHAACPVLTVRPPAAGA